MVETAGSVLIREVSHIQSILYREVPLYILLQTSKEKGSSFECDENDDVAMDTTSGGGAPTRKRQHNSPMCDVEDLGSTRGSGRGKGVHSYFTVTKRNKESGEAGTGHKSWRQVLGAPPPRGTSKVCRVEGLERLASNIFDLESGMVVV